jgi:phosphate transport system permease protein
LFRHSLSRDALTRIVVAGCGLISGGIVLLVVLFVVRESIPALTTFDWSRFATDPGWHPAGPASEAEVNITPMLAASLLATLGAVLIAAPLGLLSAVFSTFYAPPLFAWWYRRTIELLAGIPSVVIGLWGLVTLAPIVARFEPPGQSLLTAVLVLATMIVPTIAVLCDAAMASVPRDTLRAAAALGIHRAGMVTQIVWPATRGALGVAIVLAAARALGETMAVLLVSGNVVQMPTSLFTSVRTLTANIALELGYALALHRSLLFVTGLALLILVTLLMLSAEWLKSEEDGR